MRIINLNNDPLLPRLSHYLFTVMVKLFEDSSLKILFLSELDVAWLPV